jgi:hypothetical protein
MTMDWAYKGLQTLIAENSLIRLVILLDKGSDIIELRYKPLDLDILWHSPIGYHNPGSTLPSSMSSSGSFLDFYGGGWQDILPMAGWGIVKHRGAEFGLHGETPLLRWGCAIEQEEGEEVSAKLQVTGIRYPYRVTKTIRLRADESKFMVTEVLENLSSQELEFSWLQHPALGETLSAPGCRVWVPAKEVIVGTAKEAPYPRLREGTYEWPNARTIDGRTVDLSILPSNDAISGETVYLSGLSGGWYAITEPKGNVGFAVHWTEKVWPYLWFWQNYHPPDHPWYGIPRNIAIEPCTSYPHTGILDQIKNGTALRLSGRSFVEGTLVASIFCGTTEVSNVDSKGNVM